MFIGIDLGGTNIAVGIVNENGDILFEKSCSTKAERSAEEVVDDMANLTLEIIKEFKIDSNEIKAVGVGIPGLANKEGNVLFCVNLGWYDVPLKKMLEERLNIPVYIDNDATVAALAEYESGAMKGCKSGVMITLGTGVGGGIILDGKVYSGFNGVGSEIGHMVVGENFYNCNCGKNGCLETFTSSTAIIKYTQKLLTESNEASLIRKEINDNLDKLNAKIIFDCAKQGDKIAVLAVERLVKYLGVGIVNMINFIDPEIIALGGGVSHAGKYLLDLVVEEVNKNKFFKDLPSAKIVLAKLGNNAGIIGAAMVGKHGIGDQ